MFLGESSEMRCIGFCLLSWGEAMGLFVIIRFAALILSHLQHDHHY